MPACSSALSIAVAPGDVLLEAGAEPPWSRKAASVSGGIVLTVSGPISSSTYIDVAVAADSWCSCSPTARVADCAPFLRAAPPTAGRRRSACSSAYASLALAIATLPSSASSVGVVGGRRRLELRVDQRVDQRSRCGSRRSWRRWRCVDRRPAAARASRRLDDTRARRSRTPLRAKSSVTLMLMPSLISCPDRRHALGRGRHLDHHVRPVDRLPEPARFGDRARRVVREVGRHLEADVAVDRGRRGRRPDAARRRRPECP